MAISDEQLPPETGAAKEPPDSVAAQPDSGQTGAGYPPWPYPLAYSEQGPPTDPGSGYPASSPTGEFSPVFVPKSEKERTRLVRTFIVGMLILAVLLVCCIPLLVLTGHDAGVVVAPLTAIIAGLIGLFAASPGQDS
ncbi:hypothetical protein OG874_35975 [Nocardia sp. NBC_00565]|uniref:hypothetical protein n=1 Tax=Nocardia sp. NBC_00565 TaxID=2975993 RepID=UPI002E81447A|nr:hypothetical protein [Nocardia sp. NBC_00565]WUC02089.1 hypothetical protein OG874_35975 [Nocardia sp. NBC_00565]